MVEGGREVGKQNNEYRIILFPARRLSFSFTPDLNTVLPMLPLCASHSLLNFIFMLSPAQSSMERKRRGRD